MWWVSSQVAYVCRHAGPVPLMAVNTTGLSVGLTGHAPNASVQTVIKASTDEFLAPAAYLTTPHDQPQVILPRFCNQQVLPCCFACMAAKLCLLDSAVGYILSGSCCHTHSNGVSQHARLECAAAAAAA